MLDKYNSIVVESPSYIIFNIWIENYRRKNSFLLKIILNRILYLL